MISSSIRHRTFFPHLRSAVLAGVAVAALLTVSAHAQAPAQPPLPAPDQTTLPAAQTTTPAVGDAAPATTPTDATITAAPGAKKSKKPVDPQGEKVVQSKDTKKAVKKDQRAELAVGQDAKLPDKQLYDKAVVEMNKGHFDVARLDLQTMLNTYPESEYQMRAKLAVADSWYKEGGTAALTQAESEYADFRVFFPNSPEAAEAQMRIGDIYFRQMDRPDRDYSKSLHAEEEYRRMLTDYPQSVLVPQAKQRLREVQEVLASRESDIASYYASHNNYSAEIARYQTVVDTFPLYSHMDDVLIALGDAYEAQAKFVRNGNFAEAGKVRLLQLYDSEAADCYRKVVLEHSATQHAEDAKDRLIAMNLPVPKPTAAQMAASEDLENSRSSYKISDHISLLFLHKADTVPAAHAGDPSLTDPKITTAPSIVNRGNAEFFKAFAETPAAPAVPAAAAIAPAEPAPVARPTPAAAPLAFQEVGTGENGGAPSSDVLTSTPATSSGGANGTGIGVEIISHPAGTAPAGSAPAAAAPLVPADGSYGLKTVRPANQQALPAAEAAAPAPDVPNEVSAPTAPAQVGNANGKNAKPAFDKSDESSSKHKKKTGLKKLDPLPPL